MKKLIKKPILSIVLCLLLCFSLASCGGGSSGSETQDSSSQIQIDEEIKADESIQEEPIEEEPVEEEPVQEEPESAAPSNAGELGDYYVEIKGAELAEDYDGNPAIIITYAWTNNSEDTTSAMVSVAEKAFQDGVELDTAIIMDSDIYDSDASFKDVRPGTTIDIQVAYEISNTTSIVEFEISEWLSLDENSPIVSMDFDPSTL